MTILTMGTVKNRQENLLKILPVLNESDLLDKIVVVPQEPQYSIEDIEELKKFSENLDKVEILRAEHPELKSMNKLIMAVRTYGAQNYITLDDDITAWTDEFKADFEKFFTFIEKQPECIVAVDSHKAFIVRNKHTGDIMFFQDATNDIQRVAEEISLAAPVSWLCYYPSRMFEDNTDLFDYEKIKRIFTIDTSELESEWHNQYNGSVKFISHDEMWFATIAALKGIPTYNGKFFGRSCGYLKHRIFSDIDTVLTGSILNRSVTVEINKRLNAEFPELGALAAKSSIELYCLESDMNSLNKVIEGKYFKDCRKINIHIKEQ